MRRDNNVDANDDDDEAHFETTGATLTKIDQNGIEEIGNPDVVPNKNSMLPPFYFTTHASFHSLDSFFSQAQQETLI